MTLPVSVVTDLPRTASRYLRANVGLAITVVVLAAGGTVGGLALTSGPATRTVVAHFSQTVGLYQGDQVRISGVKVGTISSIKPDGSSVTVVMSVDKSQPLPADVHAVVLAPTLVTGRYVQLTPQYEGGPTLPAGADIPLADTAVPVEWDQVLTQLDKTATALGPHGANSNGALSDLITTSAADLQGQGGTLSSAIKNLSAATTTLSDNRGNLFATVNNLDTFVAALQQSDAQVTSFNQQLDGVSSILASNRQQLGTLLTTLNQSLAVITAFVNDNRGQVTTDLTSLRQLTTTIAGQRQHLADLLQVLPTAATDFSNIYDPVTAALTGIVTPLNGDSPASTLCSLFSNLNVGDSGCAAALSSLDSASPAFSALIPTLSAAQRNAYCNVVVAQPGAPTTDVTTQTCPSTTTSQRSLLAPGASR